MKNNTDSKNPGTASCMFIAVLFTILYCSSGASKVMAMQLSEAPVSVSGFKWHMKLSPPTDKSRHETAGIRFAALEITNTIYSDSLKDLRDLRLFDDQGRVVPYALVSRYAMDESVEIPFETLDRGTYSGNGSPASVMVLDFEKAVLKDKLLVETAGSDFRRIARVEGKNDLSDTSEPWIILLDDGRLYHMGESRNFTLKTGRNSFRYLRLTVNAMPGEAKAPEISEVRAVKHTVRTAPERPDFLKVEVSVQHAENTTVLKLDLGMPSPPVKSIALNLDSTFRRAFKRVYSVEGRDTLKQHQKLRYETGEYGPSYEMETPWTRLGNRTMHRGMDNTQGDQNYQADVTLTGNLNYRYLRVTIYNQDESPLPVVSAQAQLYQKFMIFEPADAAKLYLFYGSQEILAPDYGVAAMLQKQWPWDLPRWKGNEPHAAAEVVKAPGKEKWIISLALIFTVTATAFLLRDTINHPDQIEKGTHPD